MNTYKRALFASAIGMTLATVTAPAQWALTGNAAGASDFLGTTNAQDLRIRTNNTERMRITSGGSVGIGTTSPGRTLHVTDENAQIRIQDGNGQWDLWAGSNFHIQRVTISGGVETATNWVMMDNNANRVRLGPGDLMTANTSNGNVGIGSTSPTERLMVNGSIFPASDCGSNVGSSTNRWNTIYAFNGTIQTSDAQLKENVTNITHGLDAIMRLRPVSFTWKDDPGYGTKLGLIAQEVRAVVPEVVRTGANGTLGIYYSDLLPVVVKGIQEQQEMLTKEEADGSALHGTLAALDDRLAALEREAQTRGLAGADRPSGTDAARISLAQNTPNPTGDFTTIGYTVPSSVKSAELVIAEMGSGRETSRITIAERGAGEITIPVRELRSGEYFYAIVADGRLVAGRKMIVAR